LLLLRVRKGDDKTGKREREEKREEEEKMRTDGGVCEEEMTSVGDYIRCINLDASIFSPG
jgi:hypothetical protein